MALSRVATPKIPAYRLYRRTGAAVVTLSGKDFYLGKYGTPESREAYDRNVNEWLAQGRTLVDEAGTAGTADTRITVAEVLAAFMEDAQAVYKPTGGATVASEMHAYRQAVRIVRDLYASLPAAEFSPKKLLACREAMISAGWCRSNINRQCSRIKSLFGWAVAREMIPGEVTWALAAVKGIRKGSGNVRESKKVRPVPDAFVDAVEPFVSAQVWAMIQLQRMTGMRPGEVCILRASDIDMTGRVWLYNPSHHKTEHHDIDRAIAIGPRAQEIIRPYLTMKPTAYLFSPAAAERERNEDRRKARETPLTPSARARRNRQRSHGGKGDVFTVDVYRRAIARACERAFPLPAGLAEPKRGATGAAADAMRQKIREHRETHHWHPHQLRHNAATALRKEYGVDAARVILGHRSAAVTETYAELDRTKAIEIMSKVG